MTFSVDFSEEDGEDGEPVEVGERDSEYLIISRESAVRLSQPNLR